MKEVFKASKELKERKDKELNLLVELFVGMCKHGYVKRSIKVINDDKRYIDKIKELETFHIIIDNQVCSLCFLFADKVNDYREKKEINFQINQYLGLSGSYFIAGCEDSTFPTKKVNQICDASIMENRYVEVHSDALYAFYEFLFLNSVSKFLRMLNVIIKDKKDFDLYIDRIKNMMPEENFDNIKKLFE